MIFFKAKVNYDSTSDEFIIGFFLKYFKNIWLILIKDVIHNQFLSEFIETKLQQF